MDLLSSLWDTSLESESRHVSIFVATVVFTVIGVYLIKSSLVGAYKKLPPGSYGLPFIGESISFMRAQKQDKTPQWIEERTQKCGPIFKTSILGSKMVVFTGQSGNRFVFSGTDSAVSYSQLPSLTGILGKHNLFEISGARHKLIRGAITSFVRPESIQKFVAHMDLLVQQQLSKALDGKDSIEMVPLMKKITFNVTCSTFFGLADGKVKDDLLEDFTTTVKGAWSLPLNLPGTTFHKALQARARVCKVLSNLIALRRKDMEMQQDKEWDIISGFLSLRDENGEPILDIEILDNLLSLIMASHDTTAILLSLFIRHLVQDAKVCNEVLQEQNEVLKAREGRGGNLTWSDVQMMKCTWRVAQELMRFYPPLFGNFRSITRDTTFQGYDIPKGWKGFWVTCVTHSDGKIFEDPEKFDASRFDSSKKSIPPYTYVPFGAGPRICPGAEFARTEVMLIIHHLITKYRWTQMIPNEPITRDPMPYPSKGLPVKLFPRI